jgi:NAD(P)-dependent dehydrogenase (short-subunit alcohol dehydrogenase family)
VAKLHVFITGASSGLGTAFAQAYARRGARLGLVARRANLLHDLAQTLPGKPVCHVLDVTYFEVLRTTALQHIHEHGCPDIVIANAGVSAGTLTEFVEDLEVFNQILQTNLTAMVATFQPFIEAMKARGSGTLVGIASVAGVRGLPGAGAYSASKAGVMAYLESLRLELAPHGIRVLTIAPGYIDTPMTRHNPYPMPFLMSATDFAEKAVHAIAQQKKMSVIPWQMGWVARLLRWLPIACYDGLFMRAPRKPRRDYDTATKR